MDVLMPQLGETVAEGTVAQWHKRAGDHVEVDEVLLDVETDKVSMEIPAPGTGTLQSILVEAGTTVEVGTLLAVIDTGDGASTDGGHGQRAASDATGSATGASVESTAATSTAAAHADAAATANGDAQTGAGGAPADAKAADASPRPRPQQDGDQRLSPAVRRLAAENELDLTCIEGSGRAGRITRRDVLSHLADATDGDAARTVRDAPQPTQAPRSAATGTSDAGATATAAEPAATTAAGGRDGELIPFNRIRRATASHMVRSRSTSPHVLQAVEVDFGAVDSIRTRMRDAWKARHRYSLTYLPFIAHAVCRALADFPHLNASVEGDALRVHTHVNLAIAVDLGPADGLVAPVIRHAETLSVERLAHAIREISDRARNGKLGAADLAGGTYTLSNSGSFGTLITAPIINQPQVAILSTDGVRKKPVVIERPDGDAIAIRPVGILAQSFDHRAVDGAYSAAFLAKVRSLLEQSNWMIEV